MGDDSHIDASVLFFKSSSEQVIELLNSFLQFVEQMLLNCAQFVVLIVSPSGNYSPGLQIFHIIENTLFSRT